MARKIGRAVRRYALMRGDGIDVELMDEIEELSDASSRAYNELPSQTLDNTAVTIRETAYKPKGFQIDFMDAVMGRNSPAKIAALRPFPQRPKLIFRGLNPQEHLYSDPRDIEDNDAAMDLAEYHANR